MVVPIRPYRTPEEIESDFEIKRRKLGLGLVKSNNSPASVPPTNNNNNTGFNLQHNIKQHQQSPLPTYRVNSPGINIAPTVNINVQNIIKSFDDPFGQDEIHNTDLPWINDGALKMIHDFGYAMLKDDSHDIGYFRYTARRGYRSHPSRLHHWYIGAGLMVAAQMGGILAKAREFMEAGAELTDLMPGGGGEEGLGIEELGPLQSQRLPPLPVYGNQVQSTPQPQLPRLQSLSSRQMQLPQLPEQVPQVIEYTPSSSSPQPRPTTTKTRFTVPSAPRL